MNEKTSIMTVMNEMTGKSSTGIGTSFTAEDRGFVYAVARRFVRAPEDAEDITQEALLLAYRYRDAFRGDARYRTWLYRITTRAALTYLRRTGRSRVRVGAEADVSSRPVVDDAATPESMLADDQTRRLVRRALDDLEPKYRDILVVRAERSEAEAAALLGISVSNVKIRAHRARKRLKEALDELAPEALLSAA